MKIISSAVGCSLMVAMTSQAQADTNLELAPMNVIANPVIEENRIDGFSSLSSIVTEEQIRDQNALDLASALRRTPGVQITRFNPVGAFGGNEGGGVFIRGIGISRPGSEIKTYLDGVPLYMGVWGHPLLDLLPLNGMQSIAVYKGPQPHINGNNFASINLRTKSPEEAGWHGSTRISGGMFDTFSEQANLTGRVGDLDFMLSQGYARSNGSRDHAEGELANVMAKLEYRLSEQWSLGASALYTDNSSKDPGDDRMADPAVAPEYETEAGMASVSLSHEHGSSRGHLKLYVTSGEGNWLDHPNNPPFDLTITDTFSDFNSYGFRWQEQLAPWQGADLTIGADGDWLSGEVRDPVGLVAVGGSYDTPMFRLVSPYLALSHRFDLNENWSLVPSVGVRYYNHNRYEEKSAPHAGLSLVSDRLTVYANISRGINYPGLEVATLAQYIPPLSDTWEQLEPEQMLHREIGFKARPFSGTEIDVSLFSDKVKNRFIFAFPPMVAPPPTFTNFGDYTMRGLEVTVRQMVGEEWTVFAGLTLLDPSIDGLPYTPDRALSLGVNGSIAGLQVALDGQYQSETLSSNRSRAGGATNSDRVDSFFVLNARVAKPIAALGEKGELFVAVENLTDSDYSYRAGYPMPGIWGQVGFSASF